MCANSLDKLFEGGLRHTYYVEQQLMEALEELESTSSEETIQSAFGEHRTETQEQIERLEGVFETIGSFAEAETDHAIDGMIENHEEFVNQDPDQAALDRFNVGTGQMSEHYEIAAYGNLIPMAQQHGYDDVADTLEESLREEQEALDGLSEIGQEFDYGQLEAASD
jgi:ferritin-like metal-binding protein YciE